MACFNGVKIEFHILQSFPVTCLNRDDVGSPKSAMVGGIKRSRISSQCWKRQVRMALQNLDVKIATRTKKVFELILAYVKDADDEETKKKAEEASKLLSDNTLIFLTEGEAEGIAKYIDGHDKIDKNELVNSIKAETKKSYGRNGLDVALFGRMLANATDLNIEAAASFSHAITTHRVSSDIDYFTAVDDLQQSTQYIGALEFSSGTYYRYVALDLGLLESYIEDKDALLEAVSAFTKALYLAVPVARQTTMAGYCPWDYAHIYIRKGQNLQLSFDKPVFSKDGYLESSIERMENDLTRNESLMGSLFGKISEHVYGKDASYSIDDLLLDIKEDMTGYSKKE